ncbi:MAG: hypothetical protein D8M59_03180 [Planctomycetes bacterium]|nr:hypothetical protein [Planctomycetota bacterium]
MCLLSVIALVLWGSTHTALHAQETADEVSYDKPVTADTYLYFDILLTDLPLIEGELPELENMQGMSWWRWGNGRYVACHLDAAGAEGYLRPESRENWDWALTPLQNARLILRVPKAFRDGSSTLHGTVNFPIDESDRLEGRSAVRVKFALPLEQSDPASRETFHRSKEEFYTGLVNRGVPGSAWFRHQLRQATAERLGQDDDENPQVVPNWRPWRGGRTSELEDTFAIFSGGRAMSENLQLDRFVQVDDADKPVPAVDVSTIEGITIEEIEWGPLLEGIEPTPDFLASYIPADQHALFFPSFVALTRMVDEATEYGTPFLRLLEPRSEDAQTQARYQRQLCLELNDLARLIGPSVIRSVAMTGSDPYLRTGTDMAVLFETNAPAVMLNYLAAQHQAAALENPELVSVSAVADLPYPCRAATSPDRSVSSYVTQLSDTVVVVSNSLAQVKRIASASQEGQSAMLASLDEYTFFRNRYAPGSDGETAFLFVSDPTIRRWCGPRWRIANSRRIRAAAVMNEWQATYMSRIATAENPVLAATPIEAGPLLPPAADSDDLELRGYGVDSKTYNTIDFLTPIVELDTDWVMTHEADGYRQWRQRYLRNWSQNFDPLGIRFIVEDDRIVADLTIMPLIALSDYDDITRFIGDARIDPNTGDRHEDALVQLIMGFDRDQSWLRQMAGGLFRGQPDAIRTNPLGWIGSSISLYIDRDAFWDAAFNSDDPEDYIYDNYGQLPIYLYIEVADSLKFSAFMLSLRSVADQMMPDMIAWESQEKDGLEYVRITFADEDMPHLYYAVKSRALILSPREDVLFHAVQRLTARAGGEVHESVGETMPWLGESVCAQVSGDMLDSLDLIFWDQYRERLQERSWDNLYILNEWRRLYGDVDALALHEDIWGTRLTCPGGGEYVWNDHLSSYESTVYGHPLEPLPGPGLRELLGHIEAGNFGITFEHDGLRGVTEIRR